MIGGNIYAVNADPVKRFYGNKAGQVCISDNTGNCKRLEALIREGCTLVVLLCEQQHHLFTDLSGALDTFCENAGLYVKHRPRQHRHIVNRDYCHNRYLPSFCCFLCKPLALFLREC